MHSTAPTLLQRDGGSSARTQAVGCLDKHLQHCKEHFFQCQLPLPKLDEGDRFHSHRAAMATSVSLSSATAFLSPTFLDKPFPMVHKVMTNLCSEEAMKKTKAGDHTNLVWGSRCIPSLLSTKSSTHSSPALGKPLCTKHSSISCNKLHGEESFKLDTSLVSGSQPRVERI